MDDIQENARRFIQINMKISKTHRFSDLKLFFFCLIIIFLFLNSINAHGKCNDSMLKFPPPLARNL